MKARALRLVPILALLSVAGCSMPSVVQPTDSRFASRKSIAFEVSQIREFEASKRQAFDATHTVMESAGYVIETADYEAGVLNGKAPVVAIDRILLAPVNKTVTANAFVDGGSAKRTRVRIDFVSTVDAPHRSHGNGLFIEEEGVTDLAVYERVIDEIEGMLSPERNSKSTRPGPFVNPNPSYDSPSD